MASKPRITKLGKLLKDWYLLNQRPLPWRLNKDPYQIWISEVMLQQTTVAAVIPYFEKFLNRFPTVSVLAKAPLDEVLSMWSGLGYYSRARNLHKASQVLAETGFLKSAEELLKLPGFGPYTSRAVASISFDEPVGVLDGNVIRVLCRVFGLKLKWWDAKSKQKLQALSDQFSTEFTPSVINQGLMELGATVCTPHNPTCLLCPWSNTCVAREKNMISKLPMKRPRRESEVWVWRPHVFLKAEKVALVKNDYAPFLKGQLIFPGTVRKAQQRPKKFDVKHGITHHEIYIQVQQALELKSSQEIEWIPLKTLSKHNPSSLLRKVLSC